MYQNNHLFVNIKAVVFWILPHIIILRIIHRNQTVLKYIGIARGCTGCMCTRRVQKNFGGQICRGKL